MRKLAQELGVVPMALYKHVANKDELLDGMVDVVVGEIDPPAAAPTGRRPCAGGSCRPARRLLRHPWASRVIESRTEPDPGGAGVHGLDDRHVPGRRASRST